MSSAKYILDFWTYCKVYTIYAVNILINKEILKDETLFWSHKKFLNLNIHWNRIAMRGGWCEETSRCQHKNISFINKLSTIICSSLQFYMVSLANRPNFALSKPWRLQREQTTWEQTFCKDFCFLINLWSNFFWTKNVLIKTVIIVKKFNEIDNKLTYYLNKFWHKEVLFYMNSKIIIVGFNKNVCQK